MIKLHQPALSEDFYAHEERVGIYDSLLIVSNDVRLRFASEEDIESCCIRDNDAPHFKFSFGRYGVHWKLAHDRISIKEVIEFCFTPEYVRNIDLAIPVDYVSRTGVPAAVAWNHNGPSAFGAPLTWHELQTAYRHVVEEALDNR